jgi:DDE family transposase
MISSPIPAARSQYLLDLLAQVPDPRNRRGRRHALAGLLAVGIAAVIAGSRSFAAIGQWAADAGPEVLAVLGAARGPAEESTFRRAFALVSADALDWVLGAWLHTRAITRRHHPTALRNHQRRQIPAPLIVSGHDARPCQGNPRHAR